METAARLAAEEGVGGSIEFRAGDTRGLELADGAFDAVVAHTLLSHVDDPPAVIREAARVVRPGGMLGFFDGDFASLTFGHADPVQGRAYDEAAIGAVFTSPRVMRQMPRLLRAAGLDLVAFFPYVIAEAGKADYWLPAIESFRKLVPQGGGMSAPEAEAWADTLRRNSDAACFRRRQLLCLRGAPTVAIATLGTRHLVG